MQLALVDSKFKPAGQVAAAAEVFARGWNAPLVHRLAVAHAANARTATRKQKTRAEVRHSTRKLFRQKGTGRARAGMSSSPIRRGGGRTFPAAPHDNVHKQVNRKEFRAGMVTVLSQLVREQRLFVAEQIVAEQPKTKPMAKLLDEFASSAKVLCVDLEFDAKFALAVRNLHRVTLIELGSLLATDLMRADRVVISKKVLERITEMWQ